MKILLLGANGQLGQELTKFLLKVGEVKVCSRLDVDLCNSSSIRTSVRTFSPDIIVNAAAYTAVEDAETEREAAFTINARGVGVLANEATLCDSWLIHYSTDYVFDGSKKKPYLEIDTPRPINIYGDSKLAGEKAITSSNCKHLIFRTSWVLGSHGENFAVKFLKLAREKNALDVVDDQVGVPTSSHLIAKVTVAAIQQITNLKPWPSGLYHLTPRGQTTWYGISKILLQVAKEQGLPLLVDESSLRAITTSEFSSRIKRPKYSLLDTSKIEKLLSFSLPYWKNDFLKIAKIITNEIKAKHDRKRLSS